MFRLGPCRTRPIIANSHQWDTRTPISSSMERNCDCGSTYGDSSGFAHHPWRCSASSHAWTGRFIANGLNWDTRTPISSPMEMNCDFSSPYGDDSGFTLPLWRYTPTPLPTARSHRARHSLDPAHGHRAPAELPNAGP